MNLVIKNVMLAAAGAAVSCGALAADIRDQMEIQTAKAELVMPGMTAQEVATKVKDGISQWAIPANANFRSMPSTIPARPDEPQAVQRYVNGNPAMEYQCSTAFAEITKRPPPIRNPFMFSADVFQACVYPFQKGVKVYLIFTNMKKTESLTSGLFNGITKAIRGSDDEYASKQLAESIEMIRKNLPNLLIERIEVPGQAPQEPDKAAVAELMPAKADLVPAPIVAPAIAQPQPTPITAGSIQAKVEARKNLTAMGMTYHSQEQFVAAIRRKDDVAVLLFLDAGGIDLNAKEKGRTPLDVANDVGATEIGTMISERLKVPTASVVPITATPVAVPMTAKPMAPTAVSQAAAILSPSQLAELNAEIDKLDMPPAQKEEYRARAIATVSAMAMQTKALTDRIDPATGGLR